MKIIGIDPGLNATGYGIIDHDAAFAAGTIRPKNKAGYARIAEICSRISDLIEENKPDVAALERVFYQKNIATLIRSSELRGAIILALHQRNMKVCEYTPTQIKLTTTGNGRATKNQVRFFVERLLMDRKQRLSNHAIDALAIAYTALRKTRLQ
jgi:crossover junction endodeoxyribonuclease RuvC